MKAIADFKKIVADDITRRFHSTDDDYICSSVAMRCTSYIPTHDGCNSLNTESYFITTVHYINNIWELKSTVLGTMQMKGNHTSANIADELRATQTKWALPEPVATTDNEQKAYAILGWDSFGCYGHKINLVVKNALDIPEVGKLVNWCNFFIILPVLVIFCARNRN